MRASNIPAFNRQADGSIIMRHLPKHTPRGPPDILCVHVGYVSSLPLEGKWTWMLELRKFDKVRLLRHRKRRVTGRTAMAWEPTEPAEQMRMF